MKIRKKPTPEEVLKKIDFLLKDNRLPYRLIKVEEKTYQPDFQDALDQTQGKIKPSKILS